MTVIIERLQNRYINKKKRALICECYILLISTVQFVYYLSSEY